MPKPVKLAPKTANLAPKIAKLATKTTNLGAQDGQLGSQGEQLDAQNGQDSQLDVQDGHLDAQDGQAGVQNGQFGASNTANLGRKMTKVAPKTINFGSHSSQVGERLDAPNAVSRQGHRNVESANLIQNFLQMQFHVKIIEMSIQQTQSKTSCECRFTTGS